MENPTPTPTPTATDKLSGKTGLDFSGIKISWIVYGVIGFLIFREIRILIRGQKKSKSEIVQDSVDSDTYTEFQGLQKQYSEDKDEVFESFFSGMLQHLKNKGLKPTLSDKDAKMYAAAILTETHNQPTRKSIVKTYLSKCANFADFILMQKLSGITPYKVSDWYRIQKEESPLVTWLPLYSQGVSYIDPMPDKYLYTLYGHLYYYAPSALKDFLVGNKNAFNECRIFATSFVDKDKNGKIRSEEIALIQKYVS